jgi:hypothetical protein
MSLPELGRFLQDCVDTPDMLARYESMPLPDLVFALRCAGYDIGGGDFGPLVGGLEGHRIITLDRQQFDASSTLWQLMWGRSRLAYVVHELWARTDTAVRATLMEGTHA